MNLKLYLQIACDGRFFLISFIFPENAWNSIFFGKGDFSGSTNGPNVKLWMRTACCGRSMTMFYIFSLIFSILRKNAKIRFFVPGIRDL